MFLIVNSFFLCLLKIKRAMAYVEDKFKNVYDLPKDVKKNN